MGEEVRDLAQIAAHLLGLPGEDFRARLKADLVGATLPREEAEAEEAAEKGVPPGSPSVVPYLVLERAPEMVDFLERTFGAEVLYRMPSAPGGGFHAEVRLGDAHLMMGGMPGMPFPEIPRLSTSTFPTSTPVPARGRGGLARDLPPTDQFYGDRESGVKDPFGDTWYIATHKAGPSHIPRGLLTVTPFLQVRGVDGLLDFAKSAFGAATVERHADPEGIVLHAVMKVEGSMVELGEAHGPFPAIPAMLYVYVRTSTVRTRGRSPPAASRSSLPPTSPTATAPPPSATPRATSGTSRTRSRADPESPRSCACWIVGRLIVRGRKWLGRLDGVASVRRCFSGRSLFRGRTDARDSPLLRQRPGAPLARPLEASDGKHLRDFVHWRKLRRGSVYRLTPDGTGGWAFSTLASFRGGPKGAYPSSWLIEASDGFLYGTARLAATRTSEPSSESMARVRSPRSIFTSWGPKDTTAAGLVEGPGGSSTARPRTAVRRARNGFSASSSPARFHRPSRFHQKKGSPKKRGLILGSDGLLYGTAY